MKNIRWDILLLFFILSCGLVWTTFPIKNDAKPEPVPDKPRGRIIDASGQEHWLKPGEGLPPLSEDGGVFPDKSEPSVPLRPLN